MNYVHSSPSPFSSPLFRWRLRPRALVDVTDIDTSTTLLGDPIASPICVAPSALQKLSHPDGEMANAKACAEFKTCMTLSSYSTTSIEDVRKASPEGLLWFQLYVYKNRETSKMLIQRAEGKWNRHGAYRMGKREGERKDESWLTLPPIQSSCPIRHLPVQRLGTRPWS